MKKHLIAWGILSTMFMANTFAQKDIDRPIMGWSSWNTYHVNISEELIKQQADALIKHGLKEAGYNYINIDDGFFGHRDETGCGDTDATRMLQAIFQLLQSKKEYMNADVLWISDFKIPLSVPELTDKMLEYRKVDTHFYGLQLGIAENEWSPFFDRIYRIDYTPSRRY